MTKVELKKALLAGHCMSEFFALQDGQDCEIYKAEEFATGDDIIYIPDIELNHIPWDKPVTGQGWQTDEEAVDDVVGHCSTGDDFVRDCNGDEELAEHLFWYVDWQNPSSAVDEVTDEED